MINGDQANCSGPHILRRLICSRRTIGALLSFGGEMPLGLQSLTRCPVRPLEKYSFLQKLRALMPWASILFVYLISTYLIIAQLLTVTCNLLELFRTPFTAARLNIAEHFSSLVPDSHEAGICNDFDILSDDQSHTWHKTPL